MNFGPYPMSHGLTRLQSRFQADPEDVTRAKARIGEPLDAETAEQLGLVTFALDDIDWDDEVRVFFEERCSFSPDSLTGMEANLRFVGPETMESKIFSRLTAGDPSHEHHECRLQHEDSEQRESGRGSPGAQGAGGMASRLSRLVERHGA
jgi:hypothetical protein